MTVKVSIDSIACEKKKKTWINESKKPRQKIFQKLFLKFYFRRTRGRIKKRGRERNRQEISKS